MTATTSTSLSAAGSLVLVRLLPVGEKGEAGSKVKKDLEPLLAHRWTGVALTEQIDQALAELESSGLVELVGPLTERVAVPRRLRTQHRQTELFPDLLRVLHILALGQRDRRKLFLEHRVDEHRQTGDRAGALVVLQDADVQKPFGMPRISKQAHHGLPICQRQIEQERGVSGEEKRYEFDP